MYAGWEVRVLSLRSIGLVRFRHQIQIHFLKFIGTVYRKNLTLKRRQKRGKIQLKVSFVTMCISNTQINRWCPCCFPKDTIELIAAFMFS